MCLFQTFLLLTSIFIPDIFSVNGHLTVCMQESAMVRGISKMPWLFFYLRLAVFDYQDFLIITFMKLEPCLCTHHLQH